jgi:monovalent cation:H+ antiporter-2, CPA2 family
LALKEATTETIKLGHNSPVVGKTLAELNLRGMTGVTLIAVIRDDNTKINPGANFKLRAEDTLVLLGKPEKIEQAIKFFQPEAAEASGFNP